MAEQKLETDVQSIIVADDDPATLLMYRRILERRYEVRLCTNGTEVLDEFAMLPADLVILDNNMPELDGKETTEALRQSALSWNVPIIICSAQDNEDHILEGLSYGANDYIVKPIKPAELLAKITVALRKAQDATPDAALSRGSVFNGKYQIDRLLGEGGYSKVFAARNIKTEGDPWVALKIFDIATLRQKDQGMAYFLREAYEHSRLSHANIVELIDFGHVGQYYFLIMEYLDGLTLADRLAIEPDQIPETDLIYIASEVVKALEFIHGQGMIHRDIKPSNIMICVGQTIKLLDFGLAKNPTEETINLEEIFRGTPHYTSPEQVLNDKSIDIRSDIYSLGATLYSAATGTKPFDAESTVAILRMHLNDTAEPVRDRRPDLSVEFGELVDRCLQRQRDDRPSIEQLIYMLRQLSAKNPNTMPDLD